MADTGQRNGRGWRWAEAAGAAAAVFAILFTVQTITAGGLRAEIANLREQQVAAVASLALRQRNMEPRLGAVETRAASVDALQQQVLSQLVRIDAKLERIEERLP